MSDDRELLELAAKAAGWTTGFITSTAAPGEILGVMVDTGAQVFGPWNPLADDGDALRLAVKLGLLVDCDYHTKESEAIGQGAYKAVAHEDDPLAATRCAIVRAAAQIGRRMP